MASSRRDVAASQVRRNGEAFSSCPFMVSRYYLLLSGDYWPPLTCRPKRPMPGNDRMKSISGVSGSGCPSRFSKPGRSPSSLASEMRSLARRLGSGMPFVVGIAVNRFPFRYCPLL